MKIPEGLPRIKLEYLLHVAPSFLLSSFNLVLRSQSAMLRRGVRLICFASDSIIVGKLRSEPKPVAFLQLGLKLICIK